MVQMPATSTSATPLPAAPARRTAAGRRGRRGRRRRRTRSRSGPATSVAPRSAPARHTGPTAATSGPWPSGRRSPRSAPAASPFQPAWQTATAEPSARASTSGTQSAAKATTARPASSVCSAVALRRLGRAREEVAARAAPAPRGGRSPSAPGGTTRCARGRRRRRGTGAGGSPARASGRRPSACRRSATRRARSETPPTRPENAATIPGGPCQTRSGTPSCSTQASTAAGYQPVSRRPDDRRGRSTSTSRSSSAATTSTSALASGGSRSAAGATLTTWRIGLDRHRRRCGRRGRRRRARAARRRRPAPACPDVDDVEQPAVHLHEPEHVRAASPGTARRRVAHDLPHVRDRQAVLATAEHEDDELARAGQAIARRWQRARRRCASPAGGQRVGSVQLPSATGAAGRHGHGLHVLPERRGEPRRRAPRRPRPASSLRTVRCSRRLSTSPAARSTARWFETFGCDSPSALHELADGALALRQGQQDRHARGVAERAGQRPGVGRGRHGGRIRHR